MRRTINSLEKGFWINIERKNKRLIKRVG